MTTELPETIYGEPVADVLDDWLARGAPLASATSDHDRPGDRALRAIVGTAEMIRDSRESALHPDCAACVEPEPTPLAEVRVGLALLAMAREVSEAKAAAVEARARARAADEEASLANEAVFLAQDKLGEVLAKAGQR